VTRLTALALAAAVSAPIVRLEADPQQQAPTFRAGTDLVQVDVIVRDGRGEFVRALTATDFEIREDGTPQPIDFVELVDTVRPAATTDAGAAAPPTPLPPRVFVLVFDEGHLTPGPFKRLQQAATEFLERYFHPQDIGGVVIGGRMAGNRMTTKREDLIEAVRRAQLPNDAVAMHLEMRKWPWFLNEQEALLIRSGDRTVYHAVERRACNEDPDECGEGPVSRQKIDIEPQIQAKAAQIAGRARAGAQRVLAVLEAVANGLRRFDGRKTVVLLSEGFIAEEFMERLTAVTGAAARAGVTFYALDARGLDRGTQRGFLSAQTPTRGDGLLSAMATFDYEGDAPNLLATATGGLVIRNTNDFGGALRIISEDAGTYYVLAYRPGNSTLDGRFRKIDVSVKRAGVEVRARRGYVASPDLPALLTLARPKPQSGEGGRPASRPASSSLPPDVGPVVGNVQPGFSHAADVLPGFSRAIPPDSPPNEPAAALRLRPGAAAHVKTLASAPPPEGGGPGATDADAFARVGWDRYQKGDVEGARASLVQAVQGGTARPWVHYTLGMCEFALGRYREAAAAWERVRVAVPEFQPAYLDLTDAYLQAGDLGRAISVLARARQRWPRDGEILNAFGVVNVRRGLLDAAIDAFEAAIRADPGDGLAYFNAGRAYEMRFVKSRRYSETKSTWVAHEPDRRQAIAYYLRYLEKGGPFEQSSRDALQRLEWAK